MNAKRIIAREGLIILGCIGFAALCAIASSVTRQNENDSNKNSSFDLSTAWPVDTPSHHFVDDAKTIIQFEEWPALNGKPLKIEFERTPTEADIDESYQRMENARRVERKTYPSNWLSNKLMGLGGLSLLFLYPIYLLIRFIIWAIKTLRTK